MIWTQLVMSAAAMQAAVASPEAVVQRQLEAYNAHDVEAFARTFSDDVEFFAHPGRPMLQGTKALRETYGSLFAQARPTARIIHRQVMGDQVADVEAITVGGREHCCALAIYKVENGLITRVDFVAAADFMKP